MRKLFFYLAASVMLQSASAQPVSLRSDVTVDSSFILNIQPFGVKLAFDSITNTLCYATLFGDIYKITDDGSGTWYDTLIASTSDHNITHLQGMYIKDSSLYVCGNHKQTGMQGTGIVACGQLQPDNSRVWHNVVTTVPYHSYAVLFDHAFTSVITTPSGDSIIFASGARTDHGEIETANGQAPGIREVPLTTKLFIVPATSQNLILPDDDNLLDAMDVIYATGFRNAFDLAYDPDNELFGTENSGDRDDPEELNWIRRNQHYGFPWVMGGNSTPMQFSEYDASADLMINHNSLGWQNGIFYDDSGYPAAPGISIHEGVKNYGPDADKFRDPVTGQVQDASNMGTCISSFTPHRCPLGLTFDVSHSLANDLKGDGFVLCYTKGTTDSTGTLPDNTTGPFADLGEDLLHLEMNYNSGIDNYEMTATTIVSGFSGPVDAVLVGHEMYILEIGMGTPSTLRKIIFPADTTVGLFTVETARARLFPNPVSDSFRIQTGDHHTRDVICELRDLQGRLLIQKRLFIRDSWSDALSVSDLAPGFYTVRIITPKEKWEALKLIKK